MAVPTFIGQATTGQVTSVTQANASITVANGGDTVFVFFALNVTGGPLIQSVKDDLGNSLILSAPLPTGQGQSAFLYVLQNATAGARTITVKWNASGTFNGALLLEYQPCIVAASGNAGPTAVATSTTTGAVSLFSGTQLLVGFTTFHSGTGTNGITAGGGFTQRSAITNNTGGLSFMAEELLESTIGAYTANFTSTSSVTGGWIAFAIALVTAPPATLTNGQVVLGTNGGAGSIIGTAGGGNDPNGHATTNALVFDAGLQTQAVPTAGGSWTQWLNPDASGDYVGIDCGASIQADHVLLSFNNPTSRSSLVGGGTAQIQASNDAAFGSFLTLFALTNATIGGAVSLWGTLNNTIPFAPASGYFRYYRITLPAASSSPADLEFYGSYYSGVNATCAPVSITNANGTTGGSYALPVQVSMSTQTTGAAIHYTLDGSTPTTSSTLYTGPIVISSNTLVQAIASLSGLSNSRVTLASYHIGSIVPTDIPYTVNRSGYRIWSIAGDKFHDPVSGLWYWYGMNQDQNGVFETAGGGIDCYSSPDLRNWSYASNTTNIASSGNTWNRVSVVYNAANNNYVLWTQQSTSANMAVYTAPAPTGPWTQSGSTITSMDGFPTQGDHKLFVDTNGTCYLINCDNSGWHIVIHQLNATYTASSGTFVSYNNNQIGVGNGNNTPFGQQSEGFAMFKIGSTYYWAASILSPWTPGLNLYVTNTTGPLGTWSPPTNPFQPDPNELTDGAAGFWGPGPLTPSQNYAYDGQTDGFYIIPGRQGINPGTSALIGVFDRWDFRAFGVIQTTNDSFQGWRHIVLPVAVNPSTGALSINWTNNWTFDSVFPQNTGQPTAPSGISISYNGSNNPVLTWTNNQTGSAYALYLDRCSDGFFQSGLVSQVLSVGTTTFTDTSITSQATPVFYRVRAVNASGFSASSTTGFLSVPNVVGDTLSVAEAAIIAAGLPVGTTSNTYSANVPVGIIVTQSPSAGSSVPSITPVNLSISLGPAPAPSLPTYLQGTPFICTLRIALLDVWSRWPHRLIEDNNGNFYTAKQLIDNHNMGTKALMQSMVEYCPELGTITWVSQGVRQSVLYQVQGFGISAPGGVGI
jgi:hypothetical protein